MPKWATKWCHGRGQVEEMSDHKEVVSSASSIIAQRLAMQACQLAQGERRYGLVESYESQSAASSPEDGGGYGWAREMVVSSRGGDARAGITGETSADDNDTAEITTRDDDRTSSTA